MNQFTEQMLIKILGAVDAAHVPLRKWEPLRYVQNVFVTRRQYRDRGLEWASGERDVAGRKRAQRALQALVDEGLIETERRNERTTSVKLTDAGASVARALVFLPGLEDAAHFVGEVADLLETSEWCECWAGHLWLPEFVPARWWHGLLHNQTAWLIKAALIYRRRKLGYQRAIIDVPYHLRE